MHRLVAALATLVLLGSPLAHGQTATSGPVHGFAMHGPPAYKSGFAHFRYADPAARKGGEIRLHEMGTYDSFNTFILRGVAAIAVSYTHETLMVPSDEPFSRYCLVCETIEVPEDRSWVEFVLRDDARFHDGTPITVADVAWTFETLRSKGHPFFSTFYAGVANVEIRDPRRIRFVFRDDTHRDLPLILGDLPLLSKAWWATREFDRTTLEPPLGSGPYRIESFEPGRFIVLRRVEGYWAKDHPVNRGRWNFDTIRIDYFRDATVALQAFKAGAYDLRLENQSLAWSTQYTGALFERGAIRKEEIPEDRVSGMQGYAMNLRRPLFQNRALRLALTYAFDFEWSNRTLFHGAYARTHSYFNNADFAARGLPGPDELAILGPWRGKIPDEVFTTVYRAPDTQDTSLRDNLRAARRLLVQEGYRIVDGQLLTPDNKPVAFEILLDDPQFERVTLPYVDTLRRLGIEASVRSVDTAQYQRRLDGFDFDMVIASFGASTSPGSEQRTYWSSSEADKRGSLNIIGIKEPAIDAVIELIIQARDRETLVTRVRALDRLLQWGIYAVPHWHSKVDRVAYWDKFARSAETPRYGFDPTTWWVDPDKPAAREARGMVRR